MATVDELLERGDWNTAMNAWGAAVEEQEYAGRQIASFAEVFNRSPRNLKHAPVGYDPGLRARRFHLVPTDEDDFSLEITLVHGASGPKIRVATKDWNPTLCDLNSNHECTCEQLNEDQDDEDFTYCDTCDYGSDWCRFHNMYH